MVFALFKMSSSVLCHVLPYPTSQSSSLSLIPSAAKDSEEVESIFQGPRSSVSHLQGTWSHRHFLNLRKPWGDQPIASQYVRRETEALLPVALLTLGGLISVEGAPYGGHRTPSTICF